MQEAGTEEKVISRHGERPGRLGLPASGAERQQVSVQSAAQAAVLGQGSPSKLTLTCKPSASGFSSLVTSFLRWGRMKEVEAEDFLSGRLGPRRGPGRHQPLQGP